MAETPSRNWWHRPLWPSMFAGHHRAGLVANIGNAALWGALLLATRLWPEKIWFRPPATLYT